MSTIRYVPSVMNIYPDVENIIFIGEAPGKREEEEGLPFVGRSGSFLRTLAWNEINEGSSYVSLSFMNVVKVRPPKNRKPTWSEIDSWIPLLQKELIEAGRISKQITLVTLGKTAEYAVNAVFDNLNPYTVIWNLPHPSYVLRFGKKEQFKRELKEIINIAKVSRENAVK